METKNTLIVPSLLDVRGSFSGLNDWFDDNSETFIKVKGQRLFTEEETKRLCLKLSKELIDFVRNDDFRFKNMSTIEVIQHILS